MNVRTLEPGRVMEEAVRNSERLNNELRALLVYRKIVSGQGLEFDRLREYVPGDDAKMIDWNSYSRIGDLYTKLYKEERLLDALVVQDVSDSMTAGTSSLTKNEYASIVSCSIAETAIEAGDRAGFLAFSDGIKSEVPSSNSQEVSYRIAQELESEELFGGEPDWGKLTDHLKRSYGSETFLFIVSDFVPVTDKLKELLRAATDAFRGVFCVMVRDRLDSELPEDVGRAYLTDPATGENVLVNVERVRDDYQRLAREKEVEVKETVESAGGYFFLTHTDENFVDGFAKFLDRRRER